MHTNGREQTWDDLPGSSNRNRSQPRRLQGVRRCLAEPTSSAANAVRPGRTGAGTADGHRCVLIVQRLRPPLAVIADVTAIAWRGEQSSRVACTSTSARSARERSSPPRAHRQRRCAGDDDRPAARPPAPGMTEGRSPPLRRRGRTADVLRGALFLLLAGIGSRPASLIGSIASSAPADEPHRRLTSHAEGAAGPVGGRGVGSRRDARDRGGSCPVRPTGGRRCCGGATAPVRRHRWRGRTGPPVILRWVSESAAAPVPSFARRRQEDSGGDGLIRSPSGWTTRRTRVAISWSWPTWDLVSGSKTRRRTSSTWPGAVATTLS